MTTLVNRRVDIRNYNQIWLGGEVNIDTGRRFSLNVACFINSLLQPKLRGYDINFSTFKGCCITSIPVVRLKSLVTTIKNGLLAEIVSRVSSKLFHKFSKSSLDSFGDHLNNETKLHFLSPSFLTKVAQLFNPFMTEAIII